MLSSFLQTFLPNTVRRNDGSFLLSFSANSCNLHILNFYIVDIYEVRKWPAL